MLPRGHDSRVPLINVEDTVKVDVVAQGTPNTATCEEPKMASNSNIGAIINAFVATILSMVFFIGTIVSLLLTINGLLTTRSAADA